MTEVCYIQHMYRKVEMNSKVYAEFTFVSKTGCPVGQTIKLMLPDQTFWLADNINVKTYSTTFGRPVEQTGVTFGCPTGRNDGYPGQPGMHPVM